MLQGHFFPTVLNWNSKKQDLLLSKGLLTSHMEKGNSASLNADSAQWGIDRPEAAGADNLHYL